MVAAVAQHPESVSLRTHEWMKRTSCAYYAQHMLRGPEQAPYNGRFIISDHHMEWDDMISRADRVCTLAARDLGKSYYFTFAYPIWKADNNPNGKGYIFSGSQDQANRLLGDIKNEIDENPKLAHLLPNREQLTTWNVTSIRLANGHRIYARGFGTKVRGAHPDWLTCDDVLNDEDATSEVVRKRHIEYFFTAVTNMIVPGGQIVVVGTPFHVNDLYGQLSKNPRYLFKRFPAIKADGEAQWPMRYPLSLLRDKRIEVGSVRFTREQLVQPISDDMSMFPARLFRGQPTEQFTVKLGMSLEHWRRLGITSVYMGVDVAISAETGADYFVIFVIGLDQFGNRWVLDIIRRNGISFQEQLSLINEAGRKYEADLIFIESNQMQRVWGDELIRTSDLPIKKFVSTGTGKKGIQNPSGNTFTSNKNSLEGGVPALRVILENGKYRIPRGDAHSVEVTNTWIEEMQSFTMLEDGKLKGVGSHDDTVMACWIAERAIAAGGFSFSTGNEQGAGETFDAFLKRQTEAEPAKPAKTPVYANEEERAKAELAALVRQDVRDFQTGVAQGKTAREVADAVKEHIQSNGSANGPQILTSLVDDDARKAPQTLDSIVAAPMWRFTRR